MASRAIEKEPESRGFMSRPRIWMTLGAIALFTILTPVFASHPCPCGATLNSQTDAQHAGGDGQPLTWRSAQRLQHGGSASTPETRCYERSVGNRSAKSITDVAWEIAHYWKNIIAATSELCDSVEIPGSVKKPDPTGPLVFGASSERKYPTQVYAPQVTWTAAEAAGPST